MFEENSTTYGKVWEDKEHFPMLNDKKEEVISKLKSLNIGAVKCFDQISSNWEDWFAQEKITLVVMPLCNVVDQDGENTKKELESLGHKDVAKLMPVDIETKEIVTTTTTFVYFPTRNMILTKCNIFYNPTIFGLFCSNCRLVNPKLLTQEEIWLKKLEETFSANIQGRIDSINNEIEEAERSISGYRIRLLDMIKRARDKKQDLQNMDIIKGNITKKLMTEIEAIKMLPFVKEVFFRDSIYVSFGDVYVTGEVQVDTKDIKGISVPVTEKKKVYIGNLRFIIKSGEVVIENPKSIGMYQHPHARQNHICFGEADIDVEKHLLNFDLINLVKLLYSWAFSYNPGDAYISLQAWYNKRVTENEA
jgi:hypothetical protein